VGVSFWASESLKKTPSDNLWVGSDILTTWAAFELGITKKQEVQINKDKVKNFLTGLIFQILQLAFAHLDKPIC
jgi:hypothetical protein